MKRAGGKKTEGRVKQGIVPKQYLNLNQLILKTKPDKPLHKSHICK